jgi:hypothetical protein
MSAIHKITHTWEKGAEKISSTESYNVDGEASFDIDVPGVTTDKQVACNIDVSQLKSLFILSTKDVSFQTNSAGSPTNTIELKANVAYVWTFDSGITNPLTADVTAVYLTNPGASAARVQLEAAFDASI